MSKNILSKTGLTHFWGKIKSYISTNYIKKDELNTLQIPIGAIIQYQGEIEPPGFKFPNGQAISRTEYPELFNLIGTRYGEGDGSTTFNLPTFDGRTPIMRGDGTFSTLGKLIGEEKHTMTVDELVTHTHIQNAHSHRSALGVAKFNYPGGTANNFISNYSYGNGNSWYTNSNGMGTSSVTPTNQNTGKSQPFNIIQPSFVTNFLIKVSNSSTVVDVRQIDVVSLKEEIKDQVNEKLSKKRYLEISQSSDISVKFSNANPIHYNFHTVTANSSPNDWSIDAQGRVTIVGQDIHHVRVVANVGKDDTNLTNWLMFFLVRTRKGTEKGYSRMTCSLSSWSSMTTDAIIDVQVGDVIDLKVRCGDKTNTIVFPTYDTFSYTAETNGMNKFYLEVLD